MRRASAPLSYFPTWAELNHVRFNGVAVSTMSNGKGSGLVATAEISEPDEILMTIPQALILSLENVWILAKSDRHLRELLEAVGEYSRTARGAILVFLLLQLTHNNALPGHDRIGVSNPFTQYIHFLPSAIPLPTFWTPAQCTRLKGTSLEAALAAKLRTLEREFNMLRDATTSIGWCQEYWWDPGSGGLGLEDWKHIDAMYRSRALDLLGTDAMVPCIDMANHASGGDTLARYDLDADGNAILVLLEGKGCVPGEEISITYGDEKGACEMLFSYGFIEQSMWSARELYLDVDIPSDDPLKLAKKAIATSAPGFRLFSDGMRLGWEGPFVWLICVNEEDGLEFRLLQSHDDQRELQMLWKGAAIDKVSQLDSLLQTEPLWEVFKLRAITTVQGRVEAQLMLLQHEQSHSCNENITDYGGESNVCLGIQRLRDLEGTLMLHAYDEFESQKLQLLESDRVREYLRRADEEDMAGSNDEVC